MDKKTTIKILIEASFLFSPILKERLVQNIDSMTDDDISALGKMLAGDKKETLESLEKEIAKLDSIIDKYRETPSASASAI